MNLRRIVLRVVFEVVACALYYSGILYCIGWIRKHVGRRRLVVSMYHHLAHAVPPDKAVHQIERGMSPGHFAGHLRVYRWFGDIVPLADAYDELTRPTRRSRALIALTFDDGYRDNLTVGLPALAKRGVPATCFAALGAMGPERRLWWDRIVRLVRHAPGNGTVDVSPLRDVDGLGAIAPDGQTHMRRDVLAERLTDCLATKPVSRRDPLIDELGRRLSGGPLPDGDPELYVTWDELRRMSDGGFSIGGHTVQHPCLPAEPRDVARLEITTCRQVLEHRLGRPVTTFSYPGGYYDTAVRDMVEEAGYRVAVTVERGVNHAGDDPMLLKRLPLGWEAPRHLAMKLAIYDFIYR